MHDYNYFKEQDTEIVQKDSCCILNPIWGQSTHALNIIKLKYYLIKHVPKSHTLNIVLKELQFFFLLNTFVQTHRTKYSKEKKIFVGILDLPH